MFIFFHNHKKHLLHSVLFVFTVIFTLSCVSAENDLRKVTGDNVFISSNMPHVQVKISEDLTFIGMTGNSKYPLESRSNIDMPFVFESYVFGNSKESLMIQKGAIITVIKSRKSFPADLFSEEIYYARKAKRIIQDTEYQNAVFSKDYPGTTYTSEKVADLLTGKSFFLPESFIMNSHARSFGLENSMALYITYFEDIKKLEKGKSDEETLESLDKKMDESIRIM